MWGVHGHPPNQLVPNETFHEYAHRAAPFPLARVTSIDHLTILIRLNLAFHIMKKGKNIFVPLETMYYDLSEAGAQLWGQLRTEEADLNPRKALYDAIKAQVMVLATPLDQSAWFGAELEVRTDPKKEGYLATRWQENFVCEICKIGLGFRDCASWSKFSMCTVKYDATTPCPKIAHMSCLPPGSREFTCKTHRAALMRESIPPLPGQNHTPRFLPTSAMALQTGVAIAAAHPPPPPVPVQTLFAQVFPPSMGEGGAERAATTAQETPSQTPTPSQASEPATGSALRNATPPVVQPAQPPQPHQQGARIQSPSVVQPVHAQPEEGARRPEPSVRAWPTQPPPPAAVPQHHHHHHHHQQQQQQAVRPAEGAPVPAQPAQPPRAAAPHQMAHQQGAGTQTPTPAPAPPAHHSEAGGPKTYPVAQLVAVQHQLQAAAPVSTPTPPLPRTEPNGPSVLGAQAPPVAPKPRAQQQSVAAAPGAGAPATLSAAPSATGSTASTSMITCPKCGLQKNVHTDFYPHNMRNCKACTDKYSAALKANTPPPAQPQTAPAAPTAAPTWPASRGKGRPRAGSRIQANASSAGAARPPQPRAMTTPLNPEHNINALQELFSSMVRELQASREENARLKQRKSELLTQVHAKRALKIAPKPNFG